MFFKSCWLLGNYRFFSFMPLFLFVFSCVLCFHFRHLICIMLCLCCLAFLFLTKKLLSGFVVCILWSSFLARSNTTRFLPFLLSENLNNQKQGNLHTISITTNQIKKQIRPASALASGGERSCSWCGETGHKASSCPKLGLKWLNLCRGSIQRACWLTF